jgi:hypothetical protein
MHRGSFSSVPRYLALGAALLGTGCPKQELAALGPCTVSTVRERIDQNGVSQVDLLFVIDNSGSMATEQLKLSKELPRLVNVLTSGDLYAGRVPPAGIAEKDRFFNPVTSLHIGVVTSNMGGLAAQADLGPNPPPAFTKCLGGGDDGLLQNSTQVAAEGVTFKVGDQFQGYVLGDVVLPPEPTCQGIPAPLLYQAYEAGSVDGPTLENVVRDFGCVSRVGVSGCPFEQQLEAMWKAVAPREGTDPTLHTFLGGSKGHGGTGGMNEGFVRENAILAVVQVSDEEDCSIKENGRDLFSLSGNATNRFGPANEINMRCGRFGDKEDLLWPADRYVRGLQKLKPENPDRVIFAAIVGIPIGSNTMTPDAILGLPEMEFKLSAASVAAPANTQVPATACSVPGTARPEEAYPARRFLEVAKLFGENAVVYSICEDNYAPALDSLLNKIADKLTGNCLPRQLNPDPRGVVQCEVFELLAEKTTECSPLRGHKAGAPEMRNIQTSSGRIEMRRACQMQQVPVLNGVPQTTDATGKQLTGWFYDDFSEELKEECRPGEQQRIRFSFGELPAGAGATFECFQPVARIDPSARGLDAVNTRCGAEQNECAQRGNKADDGYDLICVENACQIKCDAATECPPGWECDEKQGIKANGPKYCQQPTCPADQPTGGTATGGAAMSEP